MTFPHLHLIAPLCEGDMPEVKSSNTHTLIYQQKIFPTLHLMPLLYADEGEKVVIAAKDPKWIFNQVKRSFFQQFHLHLQPLQLYSLSEAPFVNYSPQLWTSHPLLASCFPSAIFENTWSKLCQLNSKLSFTSFLSPFLETQACSSLEQIGSQLRTSTGPWVLKVPYQAAGNKMLYLQKPLLSAKQRVILEKYFSRYGTCLLQRHLTISKEFSTQWQIKKEGIDFLGACLNFVSNKRYRGCQVGTMVPENIGKQALKKHLSICHKLLVKVKNSGYVGPLGIDAMLVVIEGKEQVIPFTEINARETFASLALKIQKKYFSQKAISITLDKEEGLFPWSFSSHLQENISLCQNLRLRVV